MYDCCLDDGTETSKQSTIVAPDCNIYVSDVNSDNLIGNLNELSTGDILDILVSKGQVVQEHKLYYNDFI